MNYEALEYSTRNHVARVTLNRPEAANSMNPAFWQEMVDVFALIADDPDVRVVILDGNGKHFTSGMDLSSLATIVNVEDIDPARQRDRLRRTILELQESFSVIERCRVPVLAAIHGACIGGGMDLISACDIRYCAADSFFSIHETNIGMTADVGTLQRMPHIIPDGIMRELTYTGRRMLATEALSCGLVNAVYEDKAAMLEAVLEIAGEIASKSPPTIAGCKEMILYAREHSVADGLNYIATWNAAMMSQSDMTAAIRAQQQKAQADFDGLLPPAHKVRNRKA